RKRNVAVTRERDREGEGQKGLNIRESMKLLSKLIC
ncbi:unnamed protein product, partial [Linum tenue]